MGRKYHTTNHLKLSIKEVYINNSVIDSVWYIEGSKANMQNQLHHLQTNEGDRETKINLSHT